MRQALLGITEVLHFITKLINWLDSDIMSPVHYRCWVPIAFVRVTMHQQPEDVELDVGACIEEETQAASRPRCQCLCGCRKRPGRRPSCPRCGRLVGPGCCWADGKCHICNGQGNPQEPIRGKFEYKVVPKHHFLYELGIQAKFEHNRLSQCYRMEDFVGKISEMAHACPQGTSGPKIPARVDESTYVCCT